jgi:hypothetical protein
MYMEIYVQGNSLCSYLKQTKMSFFAKTEYRKAEQVLPRGWYQWEGKDVRKECRRTNIVEILCTH